MNRHVPLSTKIAPFALVAGFSLMALPAMGKDASQKADPVVVQHYLAQLEHAGQAAPVEELKPKRRRGSIENVVDTVATRTPSGSMVNGIEGFLAD